MSYGYAIDQPLAIHAERSERAAFIRRTYLHLAGAIFGIIALCAILMNVLPLQALNAITGIGVGNPMVFLLVYMVAFIGMSMLARYWAYNGTSQAVAYTGLVLYTVLQAIVTLPLLHIASFYLRAPHLIAEAGIMTGCLFAGLTAAAFITRKDFSFLRPILFAGMFIAMGMIICGVAFGFGYGLWFSFALVALACGFILYDTSNIIHHFRTDMHVPAALELLCSVAFLFREILWILIQTQARRD